MQARDLPIKNMYECLTENNLLVNFEFNDYDCWKAMIDKKLASLNNCSFMIVPVQI